MSRDEAVKFLAGHEFMSQADAESLVDVARNLGYCETSTGAMHVSVSIAADELRVRVSVK